MSTPTPKLCSTGEPCRYHGDIERFRRAEAAGLDRAIQKSIEWDTMGLGQDLATRQSADRQRRFTIGAVITLLSVLLAASLTGFGWVVVQWNDETRQRAQVEASLEARLGAVERQSANNEDIRADLAGLSATMNAINGRLTSIEERLDNDSRGRRR